MKFETFPLDFQWPTHEPFLFCVHHHDHYPAGNDKQGVDERHFKGRQMGHDFELKDGFRLYHGRDIPGFPVHPHRGFETITIVRKGLVDHADSLGAGGRYGQGDVQWMTAGAGVQHSEMFPLVHQDKQNTLELFQIWLNLPKRAKMVPPHFRMFWANEIPVIEQQGYRVNLVAGQWGAKKSLKSPPNSWAADDKNEVFIALIKLNKDCRVELPCSNEATSRSIYFFEGEKLEINAQQIQVKQGLNLNGQLPIALRAFKADAEFLVLQSRQIQEPVVQHGPFVMNSREEIMQTIEEYQQTQFGGWPWPRRDMSHGSSPERFARYPDGRVEKPSPLLNDQ